MKTAWECMEDYEEHGMEAPIRAGRICLDGEGPRKQMDAAAGAGKLGVDAGSGRGSK